MGSNSPLATPTVTAIPKSTKPNEITPQKPVAKVDIPKTSIELKNEQKYNHIKILQGIAQTYD